MGNQLKGSQSFQREGEGSHDNFCSEAGARNAEGESGGYFSKLSGESTEQSGHMQDIRMHYSRIETAIEVFQYFILVENCSKYNLMYIADALKCKEVDWPEMFRAIFDTELRSVKEELNGNGTKWY